MSQRFIEIIPQHMQVPSIQGMDLDAPRSLNLLARPQKAQRVGWENPDDLLLPDTDYINMPIKAPGTHLFVPADMGLVSAFQKIANYRNATSADHEHEWLHLFYSRVGLRNGEPVGLNAGTHIDDNEQLLEAGEGRVTTSFLMVSALQPVIYDGLNNFDRAEFVAHYPGWKQLADQEADDIDPHELAQKRNTYFDGKVYPPEGKRWPAGTIVCFSGVTPHAMQVADGNYDRALLHVTAYTDKSVAQTPERLKNLNPALAKAYFK